MLAKEIMTASPACCSPTDTLQAAAGLMRDNDCGAIPVVEAGKVIGIVTDRDIAVRAVAEGMRSDTAVDGVFTRDPRCCSVNDDVREVQRVMADSQVRRVPIVDAVGRVVGIVSQADLARASDRLVSEHEVAIVVERISEPASGKQSQSTDSLM